MPLLEPFLYRGTRPCRESKQGTNAQQNEHDGTVTFIIEGFWGGAATGASTAKEDGERQATR